MEWESTRLVNEIKEHATRTEEHQSPVPSKSGPPSRLIRAVRHFRALGNCQVTVSIGAPFALMSARNSVRLSCSKDDANNAIYMPHQPTKRNYAENMENLQRMIDLGGL